MISKALTLINQLDQAIADDVLLALDIPFTAYSDNVGEAKSLRERFAGYDKDILVEMEVQQEYDDSGYAPTVQESKCNIADFSYYQVWNNCEYRFLSIKLDGEHDLSDIIELPVNEYTKTGHLSIQRINNEWIVTYTTIEN